MYNYQLIIEQIDKNGKKVEHDPIRGTHGLALAPSTGDLEISLEEMLNSPTQGIVMKLSLNEK